MNWNLFIRYFCNALFSIKYRLLILVISTVALLGIYLLFEKPSYKTSWVLLLPGTERNSTINLDNLGEARSNGSGAYGTVSISPKNTYKEIALSDAVIDKAANQYGVPTYAFSKPKIRLIDQTPAMKFTLVGESKEELVYRSKLYNETFHEVLDVLRQNEIDRNFKGVESNLIDAKDRLALARRKVVEHQTESEFISDDQFKRWVNDAENLRTEKTQVEIKIAEIKKRIDSSLDQLGISAKQAESILVLMSSASVKANLERLGQQKTEEVSMQSKFAQKNPERVKVEREVLALSTELRKLSSRVPEIEKLSTEKLLGLLSESVGQNIQMITQWLVQYDGLNAQRMSLANNQKKYQERVKEQAINVAKLADLQRDHQIAEAIFSSALAKIDTSRLDIYATYPLTQLLTQPGATIVRDRLKTKLIIVAGFLICGLLSLVLILSDMRRVLMIDLESNGFDDKTVFNNKRQSNSELTTKTSKTYDDISCSVSISPLI